MTIQVESTQSGIITAAQLEAINDNLIVRSATYAARIQDILNSGQDVTIKIGYASEIGGKIDEAYTAYDATDRRDENIVVIPLELLQGGFYDGVHENTLERILAHEIGGHVWQDANLGSWKN